jgi:hypothetical protein
MTGAPLSTWPGFGVVSASLQVKNDENLGISKRPASEIGNP